MSSIENFLFMLLDEYVFKTGIRLKNRVVMGSMHLGWEDVPDGEKNLAAFYKARAKGGAGIIITGGISPNDEGRIAKGAAVFSQENQLAAHSLISQSVKEYDTKICLQILHAGRYGTHPNCVAPSAIQAPINKYRPRELKTEEVEATINDFIQTAKLAHRAGYDGVEIMGSEGYLINQFAVQRTNQRFDQWGGSLENRLRFALEIVRGIRRSLPDSFLIIFRQSLLDLVDEGNTWKETVYFTNQLEDAGVDMINTGIGWHESRIPTIASIVPHNGFSWVTAKLKPYTSVPLITTNRINDLEKADEILQRNDADLISMARPFLADPDIVLKYQEGRSKDINTCIACNQACLDHIFKGIPATCMVNPLAGKELYIPTLPKTQNIQEILVVGGGPAGLSAAYYSALMGHNVRLMEKESRLGGQFNLACRIPGKEVYAETVRYYEEQLKSLKVDVQLNTLASADDFINYDHIVWSAGVQPYIPDFVARNDDSILSYQEVLQVPPPTGKKIAIIGKGGIAVDVASYLSHDKEENFDDLWGVDRSIESPGGLKLPKPVKPTNEIYIFGRSGGKLGKSMGKTTAWIHREYLRYKNVKVIDQIVLDNVAGGCVTYSQNGEEMSEKFDLIVICTGQRSIVPEWPQGSKYSLIGGARTANELDAQMAIQDGLELAMALQ